MVSSTIIGVTSLGLSLYRPPGPTGFGTLSSSSSCYCFDNTDDKKKEHSKSVKNTNTNTNISASWNNPVVSVVNRSEIVVRPLAAMLADSGATVYSIDVDTILRFSPNGRLHRCPHTTTLEDCLAESNVVVTGVPHADFQIPTDYLAEGTTVVNVSEFTNVDEGSILLARPDIKYIPQVGKVTVAVLEQNLVRLHQKRSMSKD
jgi:5,10-methylene-tetrahydrofolate dehydrogenase/methenyl tetrahydrofolate cyclohydrolase